MSKRVPELTALEVKKLKEDGFYPLGGVPGLYLRIRNSSALFTLRYTSPNKTRREISLGSREQLTLAEAKKLALQARLDITNGLDPIEKKQQSLNKKKAQLKKSNALTIKDLTIKWLEEKQTANYWIHNKRGYSDTWYLLRKNLLQEFGEITVESLTFETVKNILSKIWQSKPHTANKLRTYLKQMIDWAMAMKLVQIKENPARLDGPLGVLMQVYKNDRKEKENFSAADFNEIPLLIAQLHKLTSMSAKATEFAILTATRSQAVRLATWDEFDLENKIWTIPLEHDKIKAPKRIRTIMLSDQAVELLESLPKIMDRVFTGTYSSHPLSDMSLTMTLRRLHHERKKIDGIGWIDPVKSKRTGKECLITVHGTSRASFRTWAKDDTLGHNKIFDQEAAELCLLHGKNLTYDRAHLETERRLIMQKWGDFCYSQLSDFNSV